MKMFGFLRAASAAFFVALSSVALAQNAGTVTNHALPIGKGAGVQGYGSLGPCTNAFTIIGKGASTDPACGQLDLTAGVAGILPIANGGTGGSTASGTLLDNITAFSSAGFLTRTGAGAYAFQSFTNGITLGNLSQDTIANSFLGNPTGGTANYVPFSMSTLTLKSTPVGTDTFIIGDSAATGALKQTTLTAAIAAVGSGVTSMNSLTGALSIVGGTGIGVTPAGSNITISNTGVPSLNGLTGALTIGPGGSISARKVLTAATTYFIRSDGSNSTCNGTANAASTSAPNCAWATPQFAISWVQSNIDNGGNAVTLQFGETSGTWVVPATGPFSCSGPFVGSGVVTLQGSSTFSTTGTLLDGVTNNVTAVQVQQGCSLTLSQLQIQSSQDSVNCFGTGGASLNFASILWRGHSVTDIFATQGCEVQQVGPDIITYTANSQNHIQASHHGEFRNAGQTTTFGGPAAYGTGAGGSFAYADFLGIIVYTASPVINKNGQTITGQQCFAADNSIIEQASLGASFFPGNAVCGTATGGLLVQ